MDRYNIFFAYAPSRINKNIHMTAINFVMIAFLILQLTLFFFSLLRGGGGLQGVAIFALVGFCVTLFLVVVQASFRWFSALAPITYRVRPYDLENEAQKDLHATDSSQPTAGDCLLLTDSTDFGPAGVCYPLLGFLKIF